MPVARIPPPHRKFIRRIASIDNTAFDELLLAVSSFEGDLTRSRFSSAVAAAFDCGTSEAGVFVDALLGAHSLLQRSHDASKTVAATIAKDSTLDLGDEEQTLLAERLGRLLEVDTLATMSRAAQLFAEDQQAFCRAQTVSDLRPIFAVGSEPLHPVGVVIHHTLQIRYHSDSPSTEGFFVTVDESALRDLRNVLDRALAKGQALRKVAKSSGLRIVEVEDTH